MCQTGADIAAGAEDGTNCRTVVAASARLSESVVDVKLKGDG